jgi:hypothetical protein
VRAERESTAWTTKTNTIACDLIDEVLPPRKSMLPECHLKELTDQRVRDCFSHLRSVQPLN